MMTRHIDVLIFIIHPGFFKHNIIWRILFIFFIIENSCHLNILEIKIDLSVQ